MKRIFGRKRRDYRLFAAAVAFGFITTLIAFLISAPSSVQNDVPPQKIAQLTLQPQESSSTTTFAYASQAASNIFRPIQNVLKPIDSADSTQQRRSFFAKSRAAITAPSMTEVVEIGKGDTLNQIFGAFNIPKAIALEAVESLAGIFSPRNFRVGQQITLLFRPTNDGNRQFRGYRFAADPLRDVIVLDTKGNGEFDATIVEKELKTVIAAKQGVITSSLIGAGSRAGVPRGVLAEMIRIYSYSVDFQRDIHEGDKFEVMYEAKIDKDGKVYSSGNMVYAKLTLSGESQPVYRFETADGRTDYFKADGSSVRSGLIRTPIDGARISSGFGFRRHPILGYSKMHKGVDFAARTGTPIFAAGDGVLAKVGWFNGYGNYIKLNHNNSLATAYGHMSRFAKGMRPGVRVKQGQIIGYVGSTGRSTGPHLHYEVMINNVQVNPVGVKVPTSYMLAGRELNGFKAKISQMPYQFRQALIATREDRLASR